MSEEEENYALAFGLVIAAGLSTSIGASVIFCDDYVSWLQNKESIDKFFAGALGFSAGVMLFISMTEIFEETLSEFIGCDCLWGDETTEGEEPDEGPAYLMAVLSFFFGVGLTYVLDYIVHVILRYRHPSFEKSHGNVQDMMDRDNKPHVAKTDEESPLKEANNRSSAQSEFAIADKEKERIEASKTIKEEIETNNEKDMNAAELEFTGLLTALAIGLHNFPEGLATFAATLADPEVGVGLAFAIAIHNIPEGLCVALPIYYATQNAWKSFAVAFLSGLSEIIGALLGYWFLNAIIGEATFGVLFGIVSGMMVTIVLKELLPTAHRYDPEDKYVTTAVLVGMIVMALSIFLFTI